MSTVVAVSILQCFSVAAQHRAEPPAMRYFASTPPDLNAPLELPFGAHGAFAARVRVEIVQSTLSRHSREAVSPYRYLARVSIEEMLSGSPPQCIKVATDCKYHVHFGLNFESLRHVYPLRDERQNRTFFMVGFFNADGLLTAKAVPITDEEYADWYTKLLR